MPALSITGTPLDLDVRAGATLGPLRVTLTGPKSGTTPGQPVNLTGMTLVGTVHNRSGKAADLTVVVTDATLGKFEFWLEADVTASLALPQPTPAVYRWDLDMIDSLGRVIPLYVGKLQIIRRTAG
jgi:hypothetical protein